MNEPFFNIFKQYRHAKNKGFFMQPYTREKNYVTNSQIPLPECQTHINDRSLMDLIQQRISAPEMSDGAISLQQVSNLMGFTAKVIDTQFNLGDRKYRRPYPSGGSKYPIELYLILQTVTDLDAGFYHYAPSTHTLELVTKISNVEGLEDYINYDARTTYNGVVMSFIKERSMPTYGYLAYKVGLIESGHIGQNIYLGATALGLGCRSFGTLNEDLLCEALRIDGYNETPFYSIGISS